MQLSMPIISSTVSEAQRGRGFKFLRLCDDKNSNSQKNEKRNSEEAERECKITKNKFYERHIRGRHAEKVAGFEKKVF